MKKVLLFTAMSAFVFAFSSCRKDYKCVCAQAGGSEYTAGDYHNIKKSTAKSSCDQFAAYANTTCEVR